MGLMVWLIASNGHWRYRGLSGVRLRLEKETSADSRAEELRPSVGRLGLCTGRQLSKTAAKGEMQEPANSYSAQAPLQRQDK